MRLDVGDDLDGVLEHLQRYEVADAPSRVQEIIQGIATLEHNPLIGRPAHGEMRALIMGRRSRGHVALVPLHR